MSFLFAKNGCGACDLVKNKLAELKTENVHIYYLDSDDPEALAMLAYYECVALSEKKLPILVSDLDEVFAGAMDIGNYLEKALKTGVSL
jgi:hypothetical protein